MDAAERLRSLDRRAAAFGKRFQRQYDTEPPVWLKYSSVPFILLTSLGIPLSSAFSPLLAMSVLATVLVVYALVVFTWMMKHRL